MENPFSDSNLDDELKLQFNKLLDAINTIKPFYPGDTSGESKFLASCEALNELVCLEVTAKPILTKIIATDRLNLSLLSAALEKLSHEKSLPTLKCLIKANPSALLWKSCHRAAGCSNRTGIYALVERGFSILMPWIAENYAWVLDHEIGQEFPVVSFFLTHYALSQHNALRSKFIEPGLAGPSA
eukprot:CAMPEP_0172324000 /NCGR_PEP_ID=MMETSP1058-20130122/50130_1 /TAXON_ID=83371 /ORGANISM="Detonula confervacea, Strain CCMP 353" /LENGTH=184 /DNA_ID=CAMNT_0013040151 /DNA_START=43 /DNA_END=594 /DNA_ORIENTATION=-